MMRARRFLLDPKRRRSMLAGDPALYDRQLFVPQAEGENPLDEPIRSFHREDLLPCS